VSLPEQKLLLLLISAPDIVYRW